MKLKGDQISKNDKFAEKCQWLMIKFSDSSRDFLKHLSLKVDFKYHLVNHRIIIALRTFWEVLFNFIEKLAWSHLF